MNPCQTKEQVAAYMAKCAPHRKDYTEDDGDEPSDDGCPDSMQKMCQDRGVSAAGHA